MTGDTVTATGSPVSVSCVESISDVDSTFNLGEADSLPPMVIPSTSEPPKINKLFDTGDGDILLMINGVVLETHKYLIKRFSVLKDRMQDNSITLTLDEYGVEDFVNTFKILYASIIHGPFEFEPLVLKSALRLATTYNYPSLRDFAMDNLEKTFLSAVERIRLAREFDIPSWEEAGYVELCEREEAINPYEASALGMDAFVQVARIREKEQRRKGEEVNARAEPQANTTQGDSQKAESLISPTTSPTHDIAPGATSVAQEAGRSGEDRPTKEMKAQRHEKGDGESTSKPSFVEPLAPDECQNYVSLLAGTARKVPGCRCKTSSKASSDGLGSNISATWRCKLPPCAVGVIKYLQTQQVAHRNNISKLETAIEQIQAAISPPTPLPENRTEFGSSEPGQLGYVQGEVRRWLARGKGRCTGV